MNTKPIILIAAVLLIASLIALNVFLNRVAKKRRKKKAQEKIKQLTQNYLDLIPLLLLKTGSQAPDLMEKRDGWYRKNKWEEIKTETNKYAEILKDQELKSRLRTIGIEIENEQAFL